MAACQRAGLRAAPTERSPISRRRTGCRWSQWSPLLPIACLLFPFGCTRPPTAPPKSGSSIAPTAQAKVQSSPNDVALRLALADEDFGAGETFAAIEQLEAARALGDKDSKLLRDLAQRYDAVGEPEAAAETLASGGENPDLALPLAETYLKLGDFQRSAHAFRPLLKSRGTLSAETQQAIVRAYLLAGDAETAAQLLPRQASQTDPEWMALTGIQALLAGQPRQAVAALQRALALNPQDAWNAYLLGKAWLAAGDGGQALKIWGAVVQGPTPLPRALIETAALLAQAGRLDEADTVLDHVQGDDRKLPAYWQTAALIARRRKHTTVEQISLGYSAYNAGDPWRAEAIWHSALAQASDDLARQIYVALSNSAARRQDAQTALSYAATAARRWPQDPDCLHQYANMLLAQNQLAEALS